VIRHQMEGTREALAEKLEKLEEQVTEKVHEVTETVADTVGTVSETVEGVTETVEETVDAVKHTFDLQWHADHHPWLLVGGAVVAGYVGGALFFRPSRRREPSGWASSPQPSSPQPSPPPPPPEPARAEKPAPSHGWLGALAEQFSGLKKLAIGTALGVLREVVTNAVPAQIGPPLSQAFNNLTEKLGGEPLADIQSGSEPRTETPSTSEHPQEESCGACL